MHSLFEKYRSLPINGSSISLEPPASQPDPYFCYPANAVPIGFEGCIMYCFINGYGDMVFASSPESCAGSYVYPLAASFEDFLRLILACGSANPVEQIIWMDREQFEQHLREEQKCRTEQQKNVLSVLAHELNLGPMEHPFEYVKTLQTSFDGSKIEYSDEYYNTLGIEK